MAIREEFEDFQWFLDFIYTDVDSLSDQKKRELIFHLLDRGYITLDPFEKTLASPPSIENALEIQTKLRGCLFPLIEKMEAKVPNSTHGLAETLVSKHFTTIASVVLAGNKKEEMRLSCILRTDPAVDKSLFDFLQSFSAIPLSKLKKCPECERYFLHLSKRKKTFCSNRCASRYLTRQRRSESEEAKAKYKEKMKNYMQRRRREESKWEPGKTKG